MGICDLAVVIISIGGWDWGFGSGQSHRFGVCIVCMDTRYGRQLFRLCLWLLRGICRIGNLCRAWLVGWLVGGRLVPVGGCITV